MRSENADALRSASLSEKEINHALHHRRRTFNFVGFRACDFVHSGWLVAHTSGRRCGDGHFPTGEWTKNRLTKRNSKRWHVGTRATLTYAARKRAFAKNLAWLHRCRVERITLSSVKIGK